jgi:putative transposase
MPQSLAQIYVHIVFSTKDRKPWLHDGDLCDQLYAYMATILRDNVDSPAILINGAEDHVHVLVRLSRKFPVMKVVQESKVETSKWLKRQATIADDFSWQAGYGAFSVSASALEAVKVYIRNQREHHRRMSFQDEFRELCSRHGLELDERYAWD